MTFLKNYINSYNFVLLVDNASNILKGTFVQKKDQVNVGYFEVEKEVIDLERYEGIVTKITKHKINLLINGTVLGFFLMAPYTYDVRIVKFKIPSYNIIKKRNFKFSNYNKVLKFII